MESRTEEVRLPEPNVTDEDVSRAETLPTGSVSHKGLAACYKRLSVEYWARERQLLDALTKLAAAESIIERQSKRILALEVMPGLQDARELREAKATIAELQEALTAAHKPHLTIDYHANQESLLPAEREMDGEAGR